MQREWRCEEGFDEDESLSEERVGDDLCQRFVLRHGIRDWSEPRLEAQ